MVLIAAGVYRKTVRLLGESIKNIKKHTLRIYKTVIKNVSRQSFLQTYLKKVGIR